MTLQRAGFLAERTEPLGDRCPVDRTMQLIGNRTTVLLLREAFYGATRFDDLVRRVGVTEAVASQRLRELVDAGVLVKQPYREPGQRTRSEYVLTEAGHELLPLVLALGRWGARHIPGGGPRLTHVGCGATVVLEARCAEGHAVPEEEMLVTGRLAPSDV
ncbi:helix-turn-helix domain-containing protein [Nocardioides sp. BP30]|uniref:winged helix-turn-helix transcriptional regulator n=1 Tax=Nocardioides sp. BP30 TaxID=3036374 RepID=UPI002468E170|nr:helix-turn-helix domain-containing protein [Nocardioides sp. BP30]WGL52392.1 helix-turn-helix domain-containing protein [Nocardioides sp. BP30]